MLRMVSSTRLRTFSLTLGWLLTTRETVDRETPTSLAMSSSVRSANGKLQTDSGALSDTGHNIQDFIPLKSQIRTRLVKKSTDNWERSQRLSILYKIFLGESTTDSDRIELNPYESEVIKNQP